MNCTKKTIQFLTSPKTIVILIILMLAACAIGFFIPQITDTPPSYFESWQKSDIYTYRFATRLQLHQVYTSYWFLALVSMIAASLGCSLYLQGKWILKNTSEHKAQSTDNRLETTICGNLVDDGLRSVLQKKRYREHGMLRSADTFIYSKNLLGRWGSVIFHAGLLLIIISAIIAACFQQRGFVRLSEGDPFDRNGQDFIVESSGILAGEFDAGFDTYLSKVDHRYWNTGGLKQIESSLVLLSRDKTRHERVRVNSPITINGTTLYQSTDYGYTLSFMLTKHSGEQIISNFNFDRAPDVSSSSVGESDYPMSPYIMKMEFMPDAEKKSFYLNEPRVSLDVSEGLNRRSQGNLRPGMSMKIGDDILQFTGARYWSGLIFVRNPGIPAAYAGFVIVTAGLAIMYLMPYRKMQLSIDPSSDGYVLVRGETTGYDPLFHEELDEIRGAVNADHHGVSEDTQWKPSSS